MMPRTDNTGKQRDAARETALRYYDAPPTVKQAAEAVVADLPAACYVDADRRYPAHTWEATWLSVARSLENGDYVKYAESFSRAAAWHDDASRPTETRIAALPEKYRTLRRSPYTADDYLFTDKTAQSRVRVADGPDTTKAVVWFREHRDAFPRHVRREAAIKLAERVSRFRLTLPADDVAMLEASSGRGRCSRRDAAAFLHKRATFYESRRGFAAAAGARELAVVAASSRTELTTESLEKIARVVDGLDRETCPSTRFDPLPEDALFAVTPALVKTAAAELVCVGDAAFTISELANVPATTLRQVLDDPSLFTPLGDVKPHAFAKKAATLDGAAARKLTRLVKAAGVSPLWETPPSESLHLEALAGAAVRAFAFAV